MYCVVIVVIQFNLKIYLVVIACFEKNDAFKSLFMGMTIVVCIQLLLCTIRVIIFSFLWCMGS